MQVLLQTTSLQGQSKASVGQTIALFKSLSLKQRKQCQGHETYTSPFPEKHHLTPDGVELCSLSSRFWTSQRLIIRSEEGS